MLQGAWLEQQGSWWCHLPGWIKGKDRGGGGGKFGRGRREN